MPLTEQLLEPIAGENPSGRNLRYVVYDTIIEARREDDDTPQGDWEHERKRADYATVLRLCCDALSKQTKDIQLAVWATEASLKTDGLFGLQSGLNLLAQLIDHFWDTLYPELEDGDAELRVAVLESLASSKFAGQLLYLPLTRDKLTWLEFKDSRVIGYEADAAGNEDKQRIREEALSDNRVSAEMFDAAVSKTPKIFYEEQLTLTESCLAALELLNAACHSRLSANGPSFAGLRDGLEDYGHVIKTLLRKKREEEPDAVAPEEVTETEPSASTEETASAMTVSAGGAAAAPARISATPAISAEPADRAEAIERIVVATDFLRREAASDPLPYLVVRALRWGELRANGEDLDMSLLEAPTSEVRKHLRALQQDGDWEQVLQACERAMSSSCGRGWLDLQRYAVTACDNLGYSAVSAAMVSALKSLLTDFPQLPQYSLNDETATANPDTLAWLEPLTKAPENASSASELYSARQAPDPEPRDESQPADAYDRAKQAASSGMPQDAIAILEREAAHERSGRGRFRRRLQLAQICMAAGYKSIALPILEALSREIDERHLEDWEDPDLIVSAFGLLYQCMDKMKSTAEQKEQIYARICRLHPMQALELAK